MKRLLLLLVVVAALIAQNTPAGGGAVQSLTTNGSSGAATLSGGVLNIPVYTGGGGGGTVTSITFSSPLTGGTITTSGTVGCSTCLTTSTTAGGDLSGTLPNPTVAQVNGGAIPASAKLAGTNGSNQLIAAALTSAHLYVGNGSNLPADVAASGDVSLANTGAFTVIQVNGAAVPASAKILGSNSSCQAIAAALTSAHLYVGNGSNLPADVAVSGDLSLLNTGAFTVTQIEGAAIPASAGLVGTNSSKQLTAISQVSYTSPTLTYLNTSLGTTSTDALFLQNTTAAASGAQQISPTLHFQGQGWKTNATAASQATDIYLYVLPVQQATNPDVTLPIVGGINGSTKTNAIVYFCADGTASNSQVGLFGLDGAGDVGCASGGNWTGIGGTGTANVAGWYVAGTLKYLLGTNGPVLGSGEGYIWYSGSTPNATTGDTSLCRAAAGLAEVYNGSACGTTAANMRDLELRSIVGGGSTPSISGCSAGTQTGGATAGTFASGTSGTCTVTFTFATTAPTGWIVTAHDTTTPTDSMNQTATITTTAATISGTTVSGDVITWEARAY